MKLNNSKAHSRRKKQAKREAVRARVLAAAAEQINQRGAASIDLKALGLAVGLSRNSLYHYFDNRQDLAYQSYLQAALSIQEDIRSSLAAHSSGAGRLKRFVNEALAKRGYEQAVLSDVDALSKSQKNSVLSVQRSNLAELEKLFSRGMKTGDFRRHNPEIAARALLGMMSWARLWYRWTGRLVVDGPDNLGKVAAAIVNGMLYGIAPKRDYVDTHPLKLQAVTANDLDLFDSQSVGEHKRLQLIGTASRVFNRKGIVATSIDDLAAELGATKGAIYHYFDDKDQLLQACYERAFDLYELFARAGEGRGKGTILALMTPLHLNCQAQASRHPPLVLQAGLASLPKHYTERARALSRRLHRTRLDAVRCGECRKNAALMVDLSAGAFFWVQKWLADNDHGSVDLLADDVTAILSNGIAA